MSQLSADRERDKLIAQEIFGWTRLDEFPNEQVKSHGWGAPSVGAVLHIIPHYSTDDEAAFQVVDKLLDGTRTFSLECWDVGGDNWQAMFKGEFDEKVPEWSRLDYAYAETRPLAICHAALKVIAEEKSCES